MYKIPICASKFSRCIVLTSYVYPGTEYLVPGTKIAVGTSYIVVYTMGAGMPASCGHSYPLLNCYLSQMTATCRYPATGSGGYLRKCSRMMVDGGVPGLKC